MNLYGIKVDNDGDGHLTPIEGGGSGGGGYLYVNVTAESLNDSFHFVGITADKTFDEIKQAVNSNIGIALLVDMGFMGDETVNLIPLSAIQSTNGEVTSYVFSSFSPIGDMLATIRINIAYDVKHGTTIMGDIEPYMPQ